MRKKIPAAAAIALSCAMLFAASGCFDLGEFEDEEEYYNSFGNVGLIAQSKTKRDYSLENYFYNEESVNDFAGSIVDADEYIYFVLPIETNMKIDSFSLYLYSETADTLAYSLFLTDRIPSAIFAYDDLPFETEKDEYGNVKHDGNGNPIFVQKKDADGNPLFREDGSPVYVEIAYDDPPAENAAGTGSVSLKAGQWVSFTVETWSVSKTQKEDAIVAAAGEYLLLRFENNGGGGRIAGRSKVSFRTTNLLIRAV